VTQGEEEVVSFDVQLRLVNNSPGATILGVTISSPRGDVWLENIEPLNANALIIDWFYMLSNQFCYNTIQLFYAAVK